MASHSSNPSSRKRGRFHGRVGDGTRPCAIEGCAEAGEFRAPGLPSGGHEHGDDRWRWLCLDHVREFNDRFNYFDGMSPEQINAAQMPWSGWERETRSFSGKGSNPDPKWARFVDPLDAIGARFRQRVDDRANTRAAFEDTPTTRALKTLGLPPDADRATVRKRYAALVRRFHPDQNGGDRSHEKALQAVVAAYSELKRASR